MTKVNPPAKASTAQSSLTAASRGETSTVLLNTPTLHAANTKPASPPANERQKFSTSNWDRFTRRVTGPSPGLGRPLSRLPIPPENADRNQWSS